MDVPPGTYTVTPSKPSYVMEYLVRGWSDGQRSIAIEVNPKNYVSRKDTRISARPTAATKITLAEKNAKMARRQKQSLPASSSFFASSFVSCGSILMSCFGAALAMT